MIAQDMVKSYWQERSARQGALTVGYAGNDGPRQEHEYVLKKNFIEWHLDVSLPTLDFGCGTGRYSDMFQPDRYLGADICPTLLDMARSAHPWHRYCELRSPNIGPELVESMLLLTRKVEQFFTATVLQHNSDEGVAKIFRQLAVLEPRPRVLFMYENTSERTSSQHMAFRTCSWYVDMVRENIGPCEPRTHSHIVHGERHSIIQCQMKDI